MLAPDVGTVVKEGAFGIHKLLQRVGTPVSGTGIVRLVRDPDGSFHLRFSDMKIRNDRSLPLRLMAFRAGPAGAARKPKDNFVDIFGEALWLDAATNGALMAQGPTPGAFKLSGCACRDTGWLAANTRCRVESAPHCA